jgi:molecular chaperone DnaK (HSP70)
MTTERIYGIDLGTTYSCIAYVDENGRPVTVANFEGDLTTPSVVYFETPDNISVGRHAKNASKLEPEKVVAFVKRSMGDPTFSFEAHGETYTPESVSSLVLRKVVGDASRALGEKIEKVVITCPAYFGIAQREATKQAGKLAGLEVVEILNEPTAAAISYGMDKLEQDANVLVYDLGGGTFDITVIAMKAGEGGARGKEIRVVVTGGNHTLGGKDWDDRLINHFAEQFMLQHPTAGDPRDDAASLQDLALAAEEAKKGLSDRGRWPFMVNHGGQRARVELTREQFEELTGDLVEQTVDLTRQLLAEAADKGVTRIDQVLLVGGSSKMPVVARRLKEAFGFEATLYDPDQAVAKGAALRGFQIHVGQKIDELVEGSVGAATPADREAAIKDVEKSLGLPSGKAAELAGTKVTNVSSKGFGIKVVNMDEGGVEHVEFLIHNNTPVPAEITETGFGTSTPNQTSVHIEVMEQAGLQEDPAPENNREVVNGYIEGLPAGLPKGSPIHVTFRLREDGTLTVRALEPSSGKNLDLQARIEGVMSEAEVAATTSKLSRVTVS